jgi:hypothetical protein
MWNQDKILGKIGMHLLDWLTLKPFLLDVWDCNNEHYKINCCMGNYIFLPQFFYCRFNLCDKKFMSPSALRSKVFLA